MVKNKRICPQCRKKVFASNERGARLLSGSAASDSDSDQPTNERAPLLRPQPQVGLNLFYTRGRWRVCIAQR